MVLYRILPLLLTLVLSFPSASLAFQMPVQKDPDKQAELVEANLDEKTLIEAKIPVEGPALLKYFRDRTTKEADRIQEETDPAVQAALVRLVGFKKPEGAGEVLLAYLPMVANDTVVESIFTALPFVTVRGGKVDPTVVGALTDKLPLKRVAAGVALAAVGPKDYADQIRGLLKDPVAGVRMRVAQALIQNNRDKEAVAVLIHCLLEVPAEKSWPAEELLFRIAGAKAPRVPLGTDMTTCKKCFAAWDAWWRDNHQAIDLAKVDLNTSRLDFTMVVYQAAPIQGIGNTPMFAVAEFDAANKVRWIFPVPYQCNAQVIGPNRVLVWELQTKRVTVRDFKGNILWEKRYAANNNLVTAQALASSNIFVAKRNWFYEYDPQGKEVFAYTNGKLGVFQALKLRDGNIAYMTGTGNVFLLDAKNKTEIHKFKIGAPGFNKGSFSELPNGNLLLTMAGNKRVVEFDWDGKEVWSLPLDKLPNSAQRQPNGNTLVTLQGTQRVVEFDRSGREVWELPVEGYVHMAQKR